MIVDCRFQIEFNLRADIGELRTRN
jgi:hypothetical protein